MSEVETPTVETVVETPVNPAPAPELPELRYEYQPTDEVGRHLGGIQVLKYRTPQELTEKLVEQNVLLTRKLREETRKNRLGIQTDEHIPEEAPRFSSVPEFRPRELSADDRVQLSRDLLDPENFERAQNMFFEATLGAKPEELRHTLLSQEERIQRLQAKAEAEAFVQNTSNYYRCNENLECITNWMAKNDLAPVRENFRRAYDVLDAAGLLLKAPIVREEIQPSSVQAPTPITEVVEPTPANPQPVQETDGRITVEEPAQAKRPVVLPIGLNRSNATDAGTPRNPGEEIVYEIPIRNAKGEITGEKKVYRGLAAFEAMPAEEFRRRLNTDKQFGALYERLLAEKAQRTASR